MKHGCICIERNNLASAPLTGIAECLSSNLPLAGCRRSLHGSSWSVMTAGSTLLQPLRTSQSMQHAWRRRGAWPRPAPSSGAGFSGASSPLPLSAELLMPPACHREIDDQNSLEVHARGVSCQHVFKLHCSLSVLTLGELQPQVSSRLLQEDVLVVEVLPAVALVLQVLLQLQDGDHP